MSVLFTSVLYDKSALTSEVQHLKTFLKSISLLNPEQKRGDSESCLIFRKSVYSSYTRRNQPSFSSVTQSCLTLCDPMDCSTPGLPVHHQLQELVQTHVHQVSDAIQPSHPLSFPSPTFNLSQHQGLF